MTSSSWLSLFAICALGTILPGPSLATIMKSTVQGSRNHGLATAMSHALGVGIYALLVTSGIGIIIIEKPWLFHFLTWIGAVYLAWMGFKAITSKSSLINEKHQSNPLSIKQAAISGFTVSLLNPKIIVFFLALFSQFITPESTLLTQLLMVLLVTMCDWGWYCIVVSISSHSRVLPTLKRRATLINRLCGVLLI
ncbi:MAG: LysE family translocator, partial [Endozoicomonas sp.]